MADSEKPHHGIPGVHFEWSYPLNPTEVRVSPAGRVALHLTVWGTGEAIDRWLCLDAPNGQLQMSILQPDEVAAWTAVHPVPQGAAPHDVPRS